MCKSEIFAKIIALVSKGTEIPTELIVSDNRVTEIVNARYILVYILYEKGFYPSQISSLIHKTKRSVNYMISNFHIFDRDTKYKYLWNELMFLTKTVEPEQTMVCLRPFFRPCRAVELTQAI